MAGVPVFENEMEQFTPAALSDLGNDVRALLCDDEQTPMRNTLRLVQSVNKAEKADCADGAQLARECVKTVYVHLVPVGDGQDLKSKQMWTFKDQSIDRPIQTSGGDILIGPHLQVSQHPAVHFVLSFDKVLANDRLRFLIWRVDPSAPLRPDELAQLDLAALSSADESSSIICIRVDARHASDWQSVARRGREWVMTSLNARRLMSRGNERFAVGKAVGVGYRRDQKGHLGLYENLEHALDFANLITLHSGERRATDLLLAVADVLVPGWTQELRRDTQKYGFPPTSRSGIATQALAMKGWDAKSHVEPDTDPTLTASVSFGRGDTTAAARREAGFAFPEVNRDKGISFELGDGTIFFFSAKEYTHGTTHDTGTSLAGSSSRTNVASVKDLLELGVLTLEHGPETGSKSQIQAGGSKGPSSMQLELNPIGKELNPIGKGLSSMPLELDPIRVQSLINIPCENGPPPPLATARHRSLAKEQMSYGFCVFPKLYNFDYQRRYQFDLEEVVLAETAGIGRGRWHFKVPMPDCNDEPARSTGAGTSARRDEQVGEPIGRLVPESGDDGQSGGSAVVTFETGTVRLTRAGLAKLSTQDQQAIKASMAAAVLEEVRLAEPSSTRRKRKAP